jgi:hypothetical protein
LGNSIATSHDPHPRPSPQGGGEPTEQVARIDPREGEAKSGTGIES